MRLGDTGNGYGWISIFLHWLTAVIIVVLLFVGNTIATLEGAERAAALNFHTSLGLASYIALWARIIWRFWVGHPGPNDLQGRTFFTMGKWAHYILLVALAGMLLSGPAMAWASGTDIVVFDWFTIVSAETPNFALRDLLHSIHRSCAIAIFVGILLHIGGVYKHTAFNHDGTFIRMILPPKRR